MHSTFFARARWSVAFALLLSLGSMFRYPGGTMLDHASAGYSLAENFLSDLGMTVSHSGQPNILGAILFIASLSIIVLALGVSLVRLIGLYGSSAHARRLGRAAGVVGLLVCAAFIGVAITPEDRMMALHLRFTLFAFRAFPLVTLLLTFASSNSNLFPRRVTICWAVLTVVLVIYVLVLGWGPDLGSPSGLTTQVLAQKIVAVTAISIFLYQTVEADRVARLRDLAGAVLPR